MVDKEVENVKTHFTKLENSADPISDGDTMYFNFNNKKSIKGESFCSTDQLTEEGKKAFLSKKVGDKVDGKPLDLFNNEKINVKQYILNIKGEPEAIDAEVADSISFELINVKKKNMPETLSEEQISQITKDESKKTMNDLKSVLEEDIKKQYDNLAMNFLRSDVYEYVSEKTKMDLPVDFLKRWMVFEKENNLTEKQVESEFDKVEKSIRWDLISAKFARENEVKVDVEEVKNELRTRYAQYFMQ